MWIPSENEWYKAAYYDPNKGGPGVGGYWAQAAQSNTITSNTIGAAGGANYYDGVDFAVTQSGSYSSTQNYLTDVGAYGLNSDSAYGTNDQAGNVFEWNDAVDGSSRGLRGGSWNYSSLNLTRFLYLLRNECAVDTSDRQVAKQSIRRRVLAHLGRSC